MTIVATLKSALTGHAGLAALVGTRVYPLRRPKGAVLPCVVYQRISWPHEYTQEGPTMTTPRFQLTCEAATIEAAEKVAVQARLAVTDMTPAGIIDGGRDLSEPDADVYAVAIDVILYTKEGL